MKLKNYLPYVAAFAVGVFTGYAIFGSQAPKIVTLPQHQAEDPKGVKQAAKASDTPLDDTQAEEIAKEVATAEKEYTISTTIEKVPEVAEAEQKKAKADFSIITDPKNPDTAFDLSKYDSKLPVELNQYNITAYKKRLWGVTYYPKSLTNWKPAMVSVDYSMRISKSSGKYMGVAAAYNTDSKKAYLGLRYEF